jgi:hypothetical protein
VNLYGGLDQAFPGLQTGLDSQEKIGSGVGQEIINFGAPVFGFVGEEDKVYNAHQDKVTLTLDGDLVAENKYTVVVNDVTVEVTYGGSHAATMTALINAINTSVDIDALGGSIAAEPGGSNRIIVIKAKGLDLTVTGAVTLGGGQANVAVANSTWGTFLGIAGFLQTGGVSYGVETSAYQINDMINIIEKGERWVPVSVAVSDKQPAYVIYTPGATQGKFTNVSANNYDCGCYFRSNRTNTLAILEVRGLK